MTEVDHHIYMTQRWGNEARWSGVAIIPPIPPALLSSFGDRVNELSGFKSWNFSTLPEVSVMYQTHGRVSDEALEAISNYMLDRLYGEGLMAEIMPYDTPVPLSRGRYEIA